MAIPTSDLHALLAPGNFTFVTRYGTCTATGRSKPSQIYLQVRVVSQDKTKELIPWREVCFAGTARARVLCGQPAVQTAALHNPYQRLALPYAQVHLLAFS